MARCEDCLHYEICEIMNEQYGISKVYPIQCGYFKLIADVVPKSEVDNLEYTLMGVMHSVDKWLEGEELEQDEVNRAATMREKTLQIIEDAKIASEEYQHNWQKIHDSYTSDCLEHYNKGRSEVAREIFAEIETLLALSILVGDVFTGKYFDADLENDIAELKKKYTEKLK